MKHGSLFSGIGGFDLAAEWMGWENMFHCEWDSFCKKVLNYYWPKAESYGDITKTDFTIWRGKIDILTGGFPCQPFSAAGKRQGKEDDRHLWPEMLRAIKEIQPRWVVGENVSGIVSWNGGLVFHEVQADLEAEGYEVQPVILPACAVNAPHRRDRVWFVAHRTNSRGKGRTPPDTECIRQQGQRQAFRPKQPEEGRIRKANRFDSFNEGSRVSGNWEKFPTQSPICGKYDGVSDWMVRHIKPEIYATITERYTEQDLQEVWDRFQSQEIWEKIGRLYKIHDPRILFKVLQLCSPSNTDTKGTSVFSEDTSEALLRKLQKHGTFANTPQGRELEKQFTIEFADTLPYLSHEVALVAMEVERRTVEAYSKWRNESIKAYGNAIVPQVAYQIFKSINQYNEQTPLNFQDTQ